MKPEFEVARPDLFSALRRSINSLKQPQPQVRRQALDEVLKTIKEESLSSQEFQEIGHISMKQLLRVFSDSSEYNREQAVSTVMEVIVRCGSIRSFLPYIFSVLTDRLNCTDLQGIASVPEKMRPAPGQKPKVIVKLVEQCEEIRLLFCTLMSKILSLVEQDDIRDKLDEIVNILRALIMDPAPEVQKSACEVLEQFCKGFKMILLHYTEQMGRAVLLPLVSKKSKIRIAGLKCLTAILWCGLWKYNAFVFQNLIGFRDPNSVPIKDFYEPSNNINYLATFINDPNPKVRLQFMNHLKIWTCDLDDKYDHHGRIVPYMLSGLFDEDEQVKQVAVQIVEEIGRQIEVEKEKDLRESKQYAIDAAWTWEGQVVDLPTEAPLKGRPSLGSRVFIRGHVRKFWTALYKQIKDIHFENRIRAAKLMLFGVIFTEQYMTQYLDVMLPHLLSSAIPITSEDRAVADLICRTLHLIGRYCEVSSYVHIMGSALKGELVQNEQFERSAMKGLTQLVNGCFESIPEKSGLCHKKGQIATLLALIEDCNICSQIYKSNSLEGLELAHSFVLGLKAKATQEEIDELMESHCLGLIRLMAVSCYQQTFGDLFAKAITKEEQNAEQQNNRGEYWNQMQAMFGQIEALYPPYFVVCQEFIQDSYLNPPTLMDADWKMIVFLHSILVEARNQQQKVVCTLSQEVIVCSLATNRSVEMMTFVFGYVAYLFQREGDKQKLTPTHQVLKAALENMMALDPVKKVPVYDQHLVKPQTDSSLIRITEDVYIPLFLGGSKAIQAFYYNKTQIPPFSLAVILYLYVQAFKKFWRDPKMVGSSIKTLWLVLQRSEWTSAELNELVFAWKEERVVTTEVLVDYLIERLQTLNKPEPGQVAMVFDCLMILMKICPPIATAADKLLEFYPSYPSLLQKFLKYALDERDSESRERYNSLLGVMCSRLRPWFQLRLRESESTMFARANLIRSILDRAK